MSDTEKQAVQDVVSAAPSDDASGNTPTVNKDVEKKLVWKTDLLIMPALGNYP